MNLNCFLSVILIYGVFIILKDCNWTRSCHPLEPNVKIQPKNIQLALKVFARWHNWLRAVQEKKINWKKKCFIMKERDNFDEGKVVPMIWSIPHCQSGMVVAVLLHKLVRLPEELGHYCLLMMELLNGVSGWTFRCIGLKFLCSYSAKFYELDRTVPHSTDG